MSQTVNSNFFRLIDYNYINQPYSTIFDNLDQLYLFKRNIYFYSKIYRKFHLFFFNFKVLRLYLNNFIIYFFGFKKKRFKSIIIKNKKKKKTFKKNKTLLNFYIFKKIKKKKVNIFFLLSIFNQSNINILKSYLNLFVHKSLFITYFFKKFKKKFTLNLSLKLINNNNKLTLILNQLKYKRKILNVKVKKNLLSIKFINWCFNFLKVSTSKTNLESRRVFKKNYNIGIKYLFFKIIYKLDFFFLKFFKSFVFINFLKNFNIFQIFFLLNKTLNYKLMYNSSIFKQKMYKKYNLKFNCFFIKKNSILLKIYHMLLVKKLNFKLKINLK